VNYVRIVGLIIIGIASVAVTFFLAPTAASVPQVNDSANRWQSKTLEIAAAIADGKANEANATTAPQQQVVNGWIARDLLEINDTQLDQLGIALYSLENAGTANAAAIVKAQNDNRDERIPYLLMLGVLAIVVVGSTQPRPVALVASPL
jgi:hypothetical protein